MEHNIIYNIYNNKIEKNHDKVEHLKIIINFISFMTHHGRRERERRAPSASARSVITN